MKLLKKSNWKKKTITKTVKSKNETSTNINQILFLENFKQQIFLNNKTSYNTPAIRRFVLCQLAYALC